MTFSSGRFLILISRTSSQYVLNVSFSSLSFSVPRSQDFEGPTGDVKAGREYFKKRFAKLAVKAGRQKEREIYIQYVNSLYISMAKYCFARGQ